MKFFSILFLLSITGISLLVHNSNDAPIEIRINDLRSNDGQIVLLLYKKGQVFSTKSNPYKTFVCKNISNYKCAFKISNLDKGEYAFIIYHDEDSNNELKTNFIGMPSEGIGSSNNHNGMPNYSKSKFYFDGKKQLQNIIIHYL